MIVKQYLDVITGRKTQTRRMKDRYQVGKVYSVVPKMYQPTVHYRWIADKPDVWHEHYSASQPKSLPFDMPNWKPLKIRITAKRQEPLQQITDTDAWQEGVVYDDVLMYWCAEAHGRVYIGKTPVQCYKNLWDSINTKPGTRWVDNPLVWVYTFCVEAS